MSSLGAQTLYTPEEYLFLERKATRKSEYLSGEILAMSGASLAHTRITLDIATELNIQLRGQKCEVVTNDMRVKTTPIVSYFYPDVVVFCGEPLFEDETFDTLLNPVVIIEVLSPSTEAYDRGEKIRILSTNCILKRIYPRFTRQSQSSTSSSSRYTVGVGRILRASKLANAFFHRMQSIFARYLHTRYFFLIMASNLVWYNLKRDTIMDWVFNTFSEYLENDFKKRIGKPNPTVADLWDAFSSAISRHFRTTISAGTCGKHSAVQTSRFLLRRRNGTPN